MGGGGTAFKTTTKSQEAGGIWSDSPYPHVRLGVIYGAITRANSIGKGVCKRAWRGSSSKTTKEISETRELEAAMWRKTIKWATSVYGRRPPGLGPIPKEILAEVLQPERVLRWLRVTAHSPQEPKRTGSGDTRAEYA